VECDTEGISASVGAPTVSSQRDAVYEIVLDVDSTKFSTGPYKAFILVGTSDAEARDLRIPVDLDILPRFEIFPSLVRLSRLSMSQPTRVLIRDTDGETIEIKAVRLGENHLKWSYVDQREGSAVLAVSLPMDANQSADILGTVAIELMKPCQHQLLLRVLPL
jgi:hypothetical protein